MTWHQWHQTASRSSNTNLFSRLACSKIVSDQGCQSMPPGFLGGAAAVSNIARRISDSLMMSTVARRRAVGRAWFLNPSVRRLRVIVRFVSTTLIENNYGAARVRLVKVRRLQDRHDLKELSVGIQFEGEFESSYT